MYFKLSLIIIIGVILMVLSHSVLSQTKREGFIQVEGGNIWYVIIGAEKKGIPLLCLHGGPGAPHDYMQPLEKLSSDRPVIFYDQLGCGKSERPVNNSLWTVERFVDELEIVRRELKLEKLHILGQSWGTMLLVDYLLTKKPTGVISIVLDAPCLSVSRWIADQKKYISEMPDKIQRIIYEAEKSGDYSSAEYQNAMGEYYKKHLCRLEEWPAYINSTFENMGSDVYNHMWGASEFSVSGTLINYERVERLKEINIPAKFICGEFDEASPASTKYYSSMMPTSELSVILNASHMHHVEKEEEYLQIINKFLSRFELIK